MFGLYICICAMYMSGAYRDHKRILDATELKLQAIVSCYVRC